MSSLIINDIMLVGCGGTGSILAPQLARLMLYHQACSDDALLHLVDGDDFEERNLERQFFSEASIALNKAISAKAMINGLGLRNVEAIADYMTAELFRKWTDRNKRKHGLPVVIAAVDNDKTRQMLLGKMQAQLDDYIFISPANSSGATTPRGHVMWSGRVQGEAVGCDLMQAYPNFITPADVIPSKGGCIEHAPSEPQLLACNFLAAAWTLGFLQNLFDCQVDPTQHAVHFDLRNLTAIAS